jgi:hypothetical protein
MAGAPRILAAFVQSTLGAVEQLDAELGARVRRRMPLAVLSDLESASRISWVPIEWDVALTECIYAEAGHARAREIFRRNLAGALEAPFLRTFVQGALRLLGGGPSPDRIFGWSARVWSQISRDCGELRFEADGPRSARLALQAAPEAALASAVWLDGMAAAIEAGFALTDAKGTAALESRDPKSRRASFRLEWVAADDGAA